MCVYVCVCACMHVCVCVCVRVCMHVYTYTVNTRTTGQPDFQLYCMSLMFWVILYANTRKLPPFASICMHVLPLIYKSYDPI